MVQSEGKRIARRGRGWHREEYNVAENERMGKRRKENCAEKERG